MTERNQQNYFDDIESKISVTQFLCVKSDDPTIHTKSKSSNISKINVLKKKNIQNQHNIKIKQILRMNSASLESVKNKTLRRKQFNQNTQLQTLTKSRNSFHNFQYGLLAKIIKNLSPDNDKILLKQKYMNAQLLLKNETQCRVAKKNSDLLVYNTLCKSKKNQIKKKKNWFKQFIQEKSQIFFNQSNNNNLQDSIQILDKSTPGPGIYNLSKDYNTKESSQKIFGSSFRFKVKRPITAQVDYVDIEKLKKSNLSFDQKSISFGTLKKNHRSLIRKVQYCDWFRSHCSDNNCTIQSQCDKKAKHQGPNFISREQRFKSPIKNYSGPDYYLKVFRNKIYQNERPFSNFIKPVIKRKKIFNIDQRDFLAQQQNTILKVIKNKEKQLAKLPPDEKKCKYQFYNGEFSDNKEHQEIYITNKESKNTGKISKRIKLRNYPVNKINKNQETPSPTSYIKQKKWGISSFNVRFQPLLFR